MKKTVSCILAVLLMCTILPTALAEVAACSQCGNTIDMRCDVCGDVYYCTKCEQCDSCGYTTPDHTMVVQYGMTESYIVTIPAEVSMDECGYGELEVGVANVILASGQSLSVYIDGDSFLDGYWRLTDAANIKNQLMYVIEHEKTQFQPGDTIMKVDAGELWNSRKSVILALYLEEEPEIAGVYSDTLTFVVEYEKQIESNTEMPGLYMAFGNHVSEENAIDIGTIENMSVLEEPEFVEDLYERYGFTTKPIDSMWLYEYAGCGVTGITPLLKAYISEEDTEVLGLIIRQSSWDGEPMGFMPTWIPTNEMQDTLIANMHPMFVFTVESTNNATAQEIELFRNVHAKLSNNEDIEVGGYVVQWETNNSGTGYFSVAPTSWTWEQYLESDNLWKRAHENHASEFSFAIKNGYVYEINTDSYVIFHSTGERVKASDTVVADGDYITDEYILEPKYPLTVHINDEQYIISQPITYQEWINSGDAPDALKIQDGIVQMYDEDLERWVTLKYHMCDRLVSSNDLVFDCNSYIWID